MDTIPYNMPYGVTPVSQNIYWLHMAVFYVCCVIAVIVFALIAYSLYKFRKSKGAVPKDIHESVLVETIWTVIPFLILIGLAIPATRILATIHDTNESALTIKVTGYQWKWKYEYIADDIKFFSFLSTPESQLNGSEPKGEHYLLEVDNEMVVPVNTKVKLLITADDVIHNWWVPELGVKQDAIPGFINENWFYATKTGKYRGQCGELCGVYHGFMPIVVNVVTQDQYAKWVMQQRIQTDYAKKKKLNKTISIDEIMSVGKREYQRSCAMCHQSDGKGLSNSYPALKGSRVVTAPIDETVLYIMRGVPSTAMQAYGKILDDDTLALIISYIRIAWGNEAILHKENYQITVSPQEVNNLRIRFNLH